MGIVRNINPAKDLSNFCDFLYGEEVGYVYMPIKDSATGAWDAGFSFEWPKQKQDIIDHVERYSSVHEVYIGPSLFSEATGRIEHVRGTHVAWAEFDGSIPTMEMLQENNIPEPTLRIRSSVPGREHWYWRYDGFQTDLSLTQGINKGIAYALGADTSGWDACQVLRPPGSLNHKREASHAVTIISHKPVLYGTKTFDSVPVPEDSYTLDNFHKDRIPNAPKTLLKYGGWSDEDRELLFRPEIKEGKRSSALMRVAYSCCERGLDNSEVYSVIQWVDKRWGKFSERDDKQTRYIALINRARTKFPYEGVRGSASSLILPLLSYGEIVNLKDSVNWIIDGILPDKGMLFVVGKSGSGKTILTTGLTKALATGKAYLDWKAVDGRPLKVMFLSLEMNYAELKEFFGKQDEGLSDVDKALLSENFFAYAARQGHKYIPLKFYDAEHTARIIATIESFKPDIVLVDSATKAIAKDLNVQSEVTPAMEMIYRIRNDLDVAMIIIHHTRKDPPKHGHNEATIDDMFGSQALQQDASAIIALFRDVDKDTGALSKNTSITYLKTRFTGDNARFTARLGDNLIFTKPTLGELIAAAPDIPKQKIKEEKKDGNFFSF